MVEYAHIFPTHLTLIRRPSSLDVQFVDFDGVRFHISTPNTQQKTLLLLSMSINCWGELVQYGALDILKREYGPLLQDPSATEAEYNVSLLIDLEQVPAGPGALYCPYSATSHSSQAQRTARPSLSLSPC